MKKAAQLLITFLAVALLFTACQSNSTVTVSEDGTIDVTANDDAPGADESGDADDAEMADDSVNDAAEPTPTVAPTATSAPTPTAAPEPTPTEPAADSSSAAPATALDDDDFCAVARELDENNPFDDPEIGLFSEEFFTVTVEFYEGVAAIAPDAIRGDVQYVLGAITELGAIADQYQYNLFDPAFAEAIESFNTTELEAAGTRIEAYLAAECGIDIGGGASAETGPAVPDALDGAFGDALDGMDLDDLDDEDLAALNDLFISQFNISPELAQCLATELDDLEAALEDPQILNRPICGTTLLQIISGINTGG